MNGCSSHACLVAKPVGMGTNACKCSCPEWKIRNTINRLRLLCGAAYQVVGAADGPVEMLDNLSAAASRMALPHKPDAGLPWVPEDSK